MQAGRDISIDCLNQQNPALIVLVSPKTANHENNDLLLFFEPQQITNIKGMK